MVVKNKAVFLDRNRIVNKPIVSNGKAFAPRLLKNFKILTGVRNSATN